MGRASLVIENYLNISRGLVPGVSAFHGFGANFDCDSGTETIWSAGGLYPWSSWDGGPYNLSVISSSNGDEGETVILQGLDENFLEISESVVLENTLGAPSAVVTEQAFSRLYRMYGATNGGVTGRVTASIGGTVVGDIPAGKNQSLSAIYTIPANKTGYIFVGDASISKGGDGLIEFFIRVAGQGGFRIQHLGELFQNSYSYTFLNPLKIPPQSDLDVRFETANNNFRVSASFDLLLIDGA